MFLGRDPLTWPTRIQIALDSARGLEYIHEHTIPVYIHRDIKSANILIDENFHAKVALVTLFLLWIFKNVFTLFYCIHCRLQILGQLNCLKLEVFHSPHVSWERLDTYHLSKFTFVCKFIKRVTISTMGDGIGVFCRCELLLEGPYISSMSCYLEFSLPVYNFLTKGLALCV